MFHPFVISMSSHFSYACALHEFPCLAFTLDAHVICSIFCDV